MKKNKRVTETKSKWKKTQSREKQFCKSKEEFRFFKLFVGLSNTKGVLVEEKL